MKKLSSMMLLVFLIVSGLAVSSQAAVDYNDVTIFTADYDANVCSISIGDLNRDNLNDLAVGLDDGRLFRLTQTGSRGVFAGGGAHLDYYAHPIVVKVAELNGDSFNDIVVGRPGYVVEGTEYSDLYREFSTDANTFDWALIDNFGSSYAGPVTADLNQDGHTDIALIRSDGTLHREFQNGSGGFNYGYIDSIGGEQHAITTGHLDATTSSIVNDIVVSRWVPGYGASAYVKFQNPTTPGTFYEKNIWNSGSIVTQLATGDLNADGKQDILVVLQDGRVFAQYQTGSRSFSGGTNILNFGFPLTAIAVGDVDSDGRDDIIVGRSTGNLYVELQQDSGNFIAPLGSLVAYEPNSIASIEIGDVDNDGLKDFAVGLTDGRVIVHYQEQGECITPLDYDLDGDCKVDINDLSNLTERWLDSTLPGEGGINVSTAPSGMIVAGSAVVNGDLSEWSNQLEWIPLDKVYPGSPAYPSDITEAKFAVRWDSSNDKIYLAVVVDDSTHTFTNSYVAWDDHDGLEIYSQGDAAGGAYGPPYTIAQQYMVGPKLSGGVWAAFGDGVTVLDPNLEYAVAVNGSQINYEVAIKQYDNYSDTVTQLDVNDIVRFDVVVSTHFGSGFGQLSANLDGSKYNNADSIAEYTLVNQLPCGAWGYLPEDFNTDCRVDFADFAKMASEWMECNLFEQGNCWN
jgi:hypothetical protein